VLQLVRVDHLAESLDDAGLSNQEWLACVIDKQTVLADPPPAVPAAEHAPLEGSLLGEVGWRLVLLSSIAVFAWLIT
jgi:hypothetical protein